MNNINRTDTHKTKCPKCGIYVSNLRKHTARGRCQYQHIRKRIRKFQLMNKKMDWLNNNQFKHCTFPVGNKNSTEIEA